MIKIIPFFFLLTISSMSFSQDKKRTKRLEEQVRIAKEQEAASHKAEIDPAQQSAKPFTIPGAQLPPLKVITSGGAMITQHDLPEHQPVLLALFNPLCDHCQKAATTIQQHRDSFKDITVVFITGMNLIDEVKKFIAVSGVEESKNFIVGGTDLELSKQIFLSKGIPQFMLYDKDRILQHICFESLDIDSSLQYLRK